MGPERFQVRLRLRFLPFLTKTMAIFVENDQKKVFFFRKNDEIWVQKRPLCAPLKVDGFPIFLVQNGKKHLFNEFRRIPRPILPGLADIGFRPPGGRHQQQK